jgi:Leucine-rich repeat (LRR) protein
VLVVEGLGGHVTYRNPAAKAGLRGVLGRDLFDTVYEVFLKDTQTSDGDLERLTELAQLETLDLTNTQVTDAAVPTLIRLKSLRRVYLTGTKISPARDQQLRQAIPGLDVIR